ncbi:DUF2946 family protein [Rhodoferax aquaticus]|uniref:DUF2946 family protein n=1 Tax=Rhodoferax aquaticus TaxID=2527691 RepID=A0A515EUK3_9BURK|nr:DUF2946 family protein [Rhodoferax aquaticus]QDL56289.1 DUF2946 family protein [Rhodoferax aquaticus]
MDDLVMQAMQKWPNVPDCYEWLGLDTRGNWYMRDDQAQHKGDFDSGVIGAKGSLITHAKLISFIERNYSCDPIGQWYFQNGPQRVYVSLAATPWIIRIDSNHSVSTHTGRPAQLRSFLLDENGMAYANTDLGLGLVHTQDMFNLSQWLEQDSWSPLEIHSSELPKLYKFIKKPSPNPSPNT